jgi:hypothetical protein
LVPARIVDRREPRQGIKKGESGSSVPLSGLDKNLSAWPPGAECGGVVDEALPWAGIAIIALVGVGLVAVLTAIVMQIGRLRAGEHHGVSA